MGLLRQDPYEAQSPGTGRQRAAALAGLVGGLTWMVLWAIFLRLHGTTEVDQQRHWLGWSHYDVSKFIVLPLLLFMVSLVGLRMPGHQRMSRWGRWGLALAFIGLSACALGAAISLWTIPWGSYAVDWDKGLHLYGGILTALGSLVWLVGNSLVAIAIVHHGTGARQIAILLVVGPMAACPWLHMTTWAGLTGLAWIAIGIGLWKQRQGDL